LDSELKNITIEDRRKESPEVSVWWDSLSLAQKFSASSLGKFGYEILFIRTEDDSKTAVLECNGGLATITEDGDINTSPNIILRAEK